MNIVAGSNDMAGRYTEHLEQFRRWSGTWHAVYSQLLHYDIAACRDRGEDGIADSTFRVVVFDGDDTTAASRGVLLDGLDIHWLDGEGIKDSHVHALQD